MQFPSARKSLFYISEMIFICLKIQRNNTIHYRDVIFVYVGVSASSPPLFFSKGTLKSLLQCDSLQLLFSLIIVERGKLDVLKDATSMYKVLFERHDVTSPCYICLRPAYV